VASTTYGCTEVCCRNSKAAVKPAGPAPMIRAVEGEGIGKSKFRSKITDHFYLLRCLRKNNRSGEAIRQAKAAAAPEIVLGLFHPTCLIHKRLNFT